MRLARSLFLMFMIGMLFISAVPAQAQTLLFPGDIVFLGYKSDDGDSFAFMLLTDIEAGTQIAFTDNGWNGNTNSFNTDEGTTVWTADSDMAAGSIIQYSYENDSEGTPVATGGGAFADTLDDLGTVGDQIIAYQGTELEPYFVAGTSTNERWKTEGDDPTKSYSFVPPTLEIGYSIRSFSSEIDNGFYDPEGKSDQGAISTGTPELLRAAINDSSSTWSRTSTGADFVFPDWDMTLNAEPTVMVHFSDHAWDYGLVVSGQQSVDSVFVVEGYDLTDDLVVTAPTGFEVSTNGADYSSSVALTPAAGEVAKTDIYLRFTPSEVVAYTDTVLVSSVGAVERELYVSGEGAMALGLATAEVSNDGSDALSGSNIFLRSVANQVMTVDFVGAPGGTITNLTLTLPGVWGGVETATVSFEGAAFASASSSASGMQISISGAALTTTETGSVTINGLTPPANEDVTVDGVELLTVEVSSNGTDFIEISLLPKFYVTIPIANIRDYDSEFYTPADMGDTVVVSGVATVASEIFSTSSLQIYLQDATGGIYVNKSGEIATVVAGNIYIARGEVDHYGGNFRVIPTTFSSDLYDFGAGEAVTPQVMTIAQVLADPEAIEGSLVTIEGLEIQDGTWGANESIEVSDDGGTTVIDLRVDGDTDIDEMEEPTGEFDATGIIYQYVSSSPYNAGYRILPRSSADISPVSSAPETESGLPTEFALRQNYPNPFNAGTSIRYALPERQAVSIHLYDITGRHVRTLLSAQHTEAGYHTLAFDGQDDNGCDLSSGVYFVRIQAGNQSRVRKMTILK